MTPLADNQKYAPKKHISTEKKCYDCTSVLPKNYPFKRCGWCIRDIKKNKI